MQKIKKTKIVMKTGPQFIRRLQNLMSDRIDQNIIKWDLDGIKILIFNKHKLSSQVLHKYFRHSNYNSFKRQMNLYNFQSNKNEDGILYFCNPLFTKNNVDYENIERKKGKTNEFPFVKTEHTNLQTMLKDLNIQQISLKNQFITQIQLQLKIQNDMLQMLSTLNKLKEGGQTFHRLLNIFLLIISRLIPEQRDQYQDLVNLHFPKEQEDMYINLFVDERSQYCISPVNALEYKNQSKLK